MNVEAASSSEQVALLAPTAADAGIAASVLHQWSIQSVAFGTFDELCVAIQAGVGVAMLVEEMLTHEHLDRLAAILAAEPPWSSTPFIVLTRAPSATSGAANPLGRLSNALLIQRPVRIENLISAIRSSLDSRRRQYAIRDLLEEARRSAGLVVVDCSFCLEEDEELSFDTAAPRRNGATLAVLASADTVLCVSGADPVALQRTVRALGELREVLPDVEPLVVINQVRRGPVPGDARAEIAEALERFAGRDVRFFLPADRRATDAALASGRTLAEVAAGSPLRAALRSLAAVVAGVPEPAGGRRRRAGRRAG